jgi:hypothetical protein
MQGAGRRSFEREENQVGSTDRAVKTRFRPGSDRPSTRFGSSGMRGRRTVAQTRSESEDGELKLNDLRVK